MICPYCNANHDKVIDSRAAEAGRAIRRRRHCQACGRRFTTYEHVEHSNKLVVVKRDGSRVPFDREKMLEGLRRACYKRPVSVEDLSGIVDEVEEVLHQTFDKEVASVEIGQRLADALKRVDQVAYVRFASVYKQFRDLDDLLDEVRDVLAGGQPGAPGQGSLFK